VAFGGSAVVEEAESHAVHWQPSGPFEGKCVGPTLEPVAVDLGVEFDVPVKDVGFVVNDDQAVTFAVDEVDVALEEELVVERDSHEEFSPMVGCCCGLDRG